MKMLRNVAVCAVALTAANTWAQDPSATQPTEPPAQDVGGVISPRMDAGAPRSITRQQVYQDLLRSEQSGEQQRLDNDLYHGR
jgi:hypothetical protein